MLANVIAEGEEGSLNFYKHHLGDYDGATAHLSWDEDMAYSRLMRVYYRRELPIPDTDRHRLTRALSSRQREAVDRVLGEFFKFDEGFWHNKRCDKEIAAYQAQCKHNQEVGPLGGRPKKTQVVSTENQSGFRNETRTKPIDNPNQNQIPEPDTRKGQERVGNAPNGARHAPADVSEIVIALPLREGGEFPVHQSLVDELEPLYPAVDIPATLKEMRGWLVLNTERRKTKRGVRRFIGSWLQGEQEKHGGQA